jgi:hypothetical protein
MSGADALKQLRTARVDTRAAQRRRVRVDGWDDLRAEIDKIERAGAPEGEGLRTTGNWSVGQILVHIARGIERSMDGFGSAPASERLRGANGNGDRALRGALANAQAAEAAAKARLLTHAHQPAGESIAGPGELEPPAQVWTPDGAARLRGAIERVRAGHPMNKPSPTAGALSAKEWETFHLRHAALHLSFVVLGERN